MTKSGLIMWPLVVILSSLICLFSIQLTNAAYDCTDPMACTITCDGVSDDVDFAGAISSASDGATISVGAGTCDFDTNATTSSSKSVYIIGSDTTITGDGIYISGGNTKTYRISGFTFTTSGIAVYITGTSRYTSGGGWRVDNCTFTAGGVQVNGYTYGVIDSNSFTGTNPRSTIGVFEGGPGDGGNASWTRTSSLGTADAVYVEDNSFTFTNFATGSSTLDGRSGCRYVLRHNTLTNCQWGSHDLEIQDHRGTMQLEVYNNDIIYTVYAQKSSYHRGGYGVVYSNRIRHYSGCQDGSGNCHMHDATGLNRASSSVSPFGQCDNVSEKFCMAPSSVAGPCDDDGDCVASGGGKCVQVDGQEDETGYPCRDQEGTGPDDATDGSQDIIGLYDWDNYICDGAACDPDPGVDGYWTYMRPASAGGRNEEGKNYFNCYTKAECETDHGLSYSSYTYPHPLRGESSEVNVVGINISAGVSIQ